MSDSAAVEIPSAGCGGCTFCCKVMGIKELAKPVNAWCPHCDRGKGCGVYATRPPSCVEFECVWLQSQSTATPLADSLRPDRCKVMLHGTPDSMTLSASVDPGCPTAWQRGGINHMIANVAKLGVNVLVGWGSGRRKILLRRGRAPGTIEIVTIKMTEADENGMQTFTLND